MKKANVKAAKSANPVKADKPNKLFYGDNLEILRKYVKDESVQMCYIDPPFNSNRKYFQIYLNLGKEDKAQAQAFTDTWTWDKKAETGYAEIVETGSGKFSDQTIFLIQGLENVLGKGNLLAYLVHITLRAREIHRVLKPNGTFFLHCDPTASHYLKIILDSIFCTAGGDFLNEIIWCYRQGGRGETHYPKKHDVIFLYSKTKDWYFNADSVRVPYEGTGGYQTSGKGVTIKGKTYFPNPKGKIPEDWWDIPALAPMDKERLGYPTQKPESLLERIIKCSTQKGDVVLDAYCGCGTTVAVCEKLGRKWIGIDVTYQAVSLILKRLEDSVGLFSVEGVELNGMPKDWESAKALAEKAEDKVRKEFEKWIVLFYSQNRASVNEKKGGDGGIDGVAVIQDHDSKKKVEGKKIIFSVKSDRTLTPAYVNQLKGKMHDENVVMGIMLTLYEPTKGMLKQASEMGTYTNKLFGMEFPKLQIISVKDIFERGSRLVIPVIGKDDKK